METTPLHAQISYVCVTDDGLMAFDFDADDALVAQLQQALDTIPREALRAAGVSDLQCYRPQSHPGTAREIADVVLSEAGVADEESHALREAALKLDRRRDEAHAQGLGLTHWSVGFVWEGENAFGQDFQAHPDDRNEVLAFANSLEDFAEAEGIAYGFFIEEPTSNRMSVRDAIDAALNHLEPRLERGIPALRALADAQHLHHALPPSDAKRGPRL